MDRESQHRNTVSQSQAKRQRQALTGANPAAARACRDGGAFTPVAAAPTAAPRAARAGQRASMRNRADSP